jgi:ribonuclease VapC
VILDASAILAVLLREPGCEDLLRLITESQVVAAGAPTLVETALALSARMRKNARVLLNEFLREAEVEIISFTRDHYEVAVDAFERYGKGRHSAALNFGDCMTYAVARISGMPLLFTGKDFSKTDILRVRS